jgi:hypothetical protein
LNGIFLVLPHYFIALFYIFLAKILPLNFVIGYRLFSKSLFIQLDCSRKLFIDNNYWRGIDLNNVANEASPTKKFYGLKHCLMRMLVTGFFAWTKKAGYIESPTFPSAR